MTANEFNIQNNGPTQQQFGDHNTQTQHNTLSDPSQFFEAIISELTASTATDAEKKQAVTSVKQLQELGATTPAPVAGAESVPMSADAQTPQSMFDSLWDVLRPYSKLIGRVIIKSGEAALNTVKERNWVVAALMAAINELGEEV